MKALKVNYINTISFLIYLLTLLSSCSGQKNYDPELVEPDIDDAGMDHGYYYTPLGCLLCFPWQYETEFIDSPAIIYYFKDKPLPNSKRPYNDLENNIVFELQRDRTLKYWFKSDYIISPDSIDTLSDGTKSFSHNILKSNQLKIKKIYNQGVWSVNFNDSTIEINFGDNKLGLEKLKGKYKVLGSAQMVLEVSSSIDSMYLGKMEKIEKRSTLYFAH